MIVSVVKSLGQKTTLVQILDLHRLNCFGQPKPKYTRIKVKLAIERALDVFRLPKAMLLTRKRHVSNGIPLVRSASTILSAWSAGTTLSSNP